MSAMTITRLGAAADRHGGLFTTAEAQAEGIAPKTLTRLVQTGAIERVLQGVYRLPGTLETEHDDVLAKWLALGGTFPAHSEVPNIVAAGQTAAVLHEVGDFLPFQSDFITPRRRATRHAYVRLRTRCLERQDVTVAHRVPTLTVEATVADLMGLRTDRSLLLDVYGDAKRGGKLGRPQRLAELLAPYARRNGLPDNDGAAVLHDLERDSEVNR